MARLSEELITEIKNTVDLLRLVESQGYKLKSHGVKDKALSCPFHEDKTESCIITPSENLFNCFGCGEGGSVIDWVMKTQGVSFRHAVEILAAPDILSSAALAHPCASPKIRAVKYGTTQKLPTPLAADVDLQGTLKHVLSYYHDTLKQSPEALEYLAGRGLNHPELIDTFKLGFANRTLGYRLPQKNRQEGAEIRGKLQQIGLLRKSGHEHFNGSIVIPVLMPKDGQNVGEPRGSSLTDDKVVVTEVYGRKLLDNLRKGTLKHTYLPGAHRGVWNVSSLAACSSTEKEVILCESLIDAMTFWVHGFRNVTASYGTNGFTDDHLKAFKLHKIKRVLIAYDRDEAGNKAAEALAEKLMSEGFDVFRILFPKGMDANEYSRQVTPAQKSLGLAIRKAQWMGNGVAPIIKTSSSNKNIATEADEVITPEVDENALSLAAAATVELAEPLQTSPMPDEAEKLHISENDNELTINIGELTYRIRGVDKNTSVEQLKINLFVKRAEAFHVDNLDLYASRARFSFIKQASIELSVAEQTLKVDLGKLLVYLESKQARATQEKLDNQTYSQVSLTAQERKAALNLLTDKFLLSRILEDFDTCGVVGEHTNKLVGYLAAVSRMLDNPLAIMIQSSSAAGKSSLMDAVLDMVPLEERIQFSAMTGQSLFYMGETNLKHKILAIAEEEGAAQASYALKLLQSEGEVTIASTGKNAATGNLETQQYKVEGPVMLMMTTTAIDIDEELMNRCLVLSVNETREQTQAIHQKQRHSQTLAGLLQKQDKKQVLALHQNAQRLIRPLLVANPYAEQLTFLSDKTRARRDHMKYLTLIRVITLLHQYQREIKRVEHHGELLEYIEVTVQDIETANAIAHEVLGRSLDELPPQTRKLLNLVAEMVEQHSKSENLKQSDYRFSRKQVREFTGWGNTQLKIHLMRLEDMEYLLIHKGGRGQSIVYELLYQKQSEASHRFVQGLIPTEALTAVNNGYDKKKSGQSDNQSGSSRAQVGGVSGSGRGVESEVNKDLAVNLHNLSQKALSESSKVIEKQSHHTVHAV